MTVAGERPVWNPAIENLSADALADLQLERLKRQLAYNFENGPFHRRKFEEAGARPEDIRELADFARLPLMNKEEHRIAQADSLDRHGDPFHLFGCAPRNRILRINATSGTTGMPTLYGLTGNDIDVVNEMHARKYWRAGIRPGSTMLQALSLSMFTGGLPLSQGIMHLGAAVVPVGVEGGAERVLEFVRLTRADALIATPSFGLLLIEKCREIAGIDAAGLGITRFFCAGEPGGSEPDIRSRLADGFAAQVYDHTGGGHAFHGISCGHTEEDGFCGMHFVSPDHCLLELIDSATGRPVELADGAAGEMVWTFLDWEGGPFMRYAMGDVAEIRTRPCACGLPGLRFRIAGRADDMLIVKGVNVYPQAIAGAVSRFEPRVTGHCRIVLSAPGPRVDPPLRIRLEQGAGTSEGDLPALEQEMADHFRKSLRISPRFEWVEAHSLPRETMKTALVVIEGP